MQLVAARQPVEQGLLALLGGDQRLLLVSKHLQTFIQDLDLLGAQ